MSPTPPPLPPPPGWAGDPPDDVLARYSAGGLDLPSAVAVEEAMSRSASVRARVGAQVDPRRLDATWQAIEVELAAPPAPVLERIVRRLGVPEPVARLAVATPALRRSWWIATFVVLLFGLGAADPARPDDGLLLLLTLAPLIPVVGVALAYGPGVDPAYEVTVASPTDGLRLVLLRALTVLGVSVPLTGLAALLAPGRSLMAAAWLVPALALTAVCLALTTWIPPRRAAFVVTGGWVVAVTVSGRAVDVPLAAFGPVGQVVVGVLGVIAALVVVARRERFDLAQLAAR